VDGVNAMTIPAIAGHLSGVRISLFMVLSGPGFVVFSQVPARADSLVAEVREALESYGLAPAPVSVHLRAAYSHAIPGGQSARCSDNLALAMHPSGSAQKFRNSWVSARETRKSVSFIWHL
jgi:hypothetical protein